MDKIILIQKEYKELLISLLPKLKSGFAAEALDEINIFWLRNMNIVRLYLEAIVPYSDSYVFTAATFLDYEDNEHLPFSGTDFGLHVAPSPSQVDSQESFLNWRHRVRHRVSLFLWGL